jgi:transglutaminase-like putative cysteine protease
MMLAKRYRGIPLVAVMALSGFCTSAQAIAAKDAADIHPNVTILQDDTEYDVHADGSYTKDEVESFRIETEQGVTRNAQMPLRYSASLEALEVLEAYTVTKDGRRIDVTPDQIREQQSAESARAPMFDDNKVKVVVFPGVEVGATLTLHSRTTQKAPLFPGEFSALEYFDDQTPRVSTHLTIRAPQSMTLHVDAVDLPGGRVEPDKAQTQLWKWSLSNLPAQAPELSSISDVNHSPRVAVTTFADYAAIGAAYQRRAKPAAAVSPRIQALADQLTQGVSDRRRQAEILYDWVSANIRYVAIYLGFGGVVPHSADAILAAAYGDCKDHVTLLEALLAAKGIHSEPVLVNAGGIYWMPKVALPLGVFNHAITYLPEFDLFVDSTASFARFGVLPPTELGKAALVTGNDADAGGLRTLPLSGPDNAHVQVTIRMTVDRDGTISGASQVADSGIFDLAARQIFASLPPGVEPQIAERILSATNQDGSGNYQHGDPRDLGQPFDFSTQFTLADYALFPGPGAIQVPAGLGSFTRINGAFDQAGPETRRYPIAVPGRQVTETSIITFPAGVSIPRLPAPVDIESSFGTYSASYSASYRAEGSTVTVVRDLRLKPSGPLITPAYYAEFRKMARAVKRDLRAQLVY